MHPSSRPLIRAVVSTLLIFGWLASSVALAEDDEGPVWTPPKSEKWDWIHLNSGEWLKGEVNSLRDRKIKFDSDELGDLTIDLVDCHEVYLQRLSFLRLESGDSPQGRGVLRGDLLEFETVGGRTLSIARDEIIGIVPGGERELDYWSLELGADYSLQDGNTDQVDLSGRVGIYRRTATFRFLNDYRGIYGSQNGAKSANNHRATSQLDIFLTSRFYVTAPTIEFYQDEFKNVKARVSPGAGIGYELIRNAFAELDINLDAVYQFQETENGESSDDFASVLGASLDFNLPGGTELDTSYRVQVVATDMDKTSHHFESVLSVDIWGPLDLEMTFMLDRIEKPEEDDGGVRADSNDIRIMAGFSVDL